MCPYVSRAGKEAHDDDPRDGGADGMTFPEDYIGHVLHGDCR
jgi:hypothetical protein